MEIRYFMCSKCRRTSAGYYDGDKKVQCGALMGFIIRDGQEVPYGCGGSFVEITKEKATDLAYEDRS